MEVCVFEYRKTVLCNHCSHTATRLHVLHCTPEHHGCHAEPRSSALFWNLRLSSITGCAKPFRKISRTWSGFAIDEMVCEKGSRRGRLRGYIGVIITEIVHYVIVFIRLHRSYSKRRLGLTLGPSVDLDTELNRIHRIRYFGVIGGDIFVISALSHALLIPLHDVP